MRHKELRIALVCYGGVSLAVYMHGVTKELWKLLRASRAFHTGQSPGEGSEGVYTALLRQLREEHGLSLSVMTDIVAGASAGGINSVFLAQAIHSGQSLDPLTELWLSEADIDVLLDPDARPGARTAKFWMTPVASYLLQRPGNGVSSSVSPETREEVREKLSRLIRSRWFEPPFSGIGLSRLLLRALKAMAEGPTAVPLLPPGHPLDLFVTTTDFSGRLQPLRLHSPELVYESEHRLSIGFRGKVPDTPGKPLAPLLDLVFATRATSSFPGAFPALQISEIEQLADKENMGWESRDRFLERIMPEHVQAGDVERVSLIDGSVLVNAPFADAMAVLHERPAHREVDRRFVYVDPTPQQTFPGTPDDPKGPPGFVATIFGAVSAIPREQPIRDNLEALETASRETATLRTIAESLRPEIEDAVEKLFGRTLFLDRPTPKRLSAWRAKAQQAAWQQAGFAYHGYSQVKFSGILTLLTRIVMQAAPGVGSRRAVNDALSASLTAQGLDRLSALRGSASPPVIAFFRQHDLSFRIRRLRLLAQRTTEETILYDAADETAADRMLGITYEALSLYQAKESVSALGSAFAGVASKVFEDPAAVLEWIATRRNLPQLDSQVDTMIAEGLGALPSAARRRLLLAYLGFPFYDTVTLPLLRGEGSNEFDPAKVDRISPDDCHAFAATSALRGTEFYNFGAFFSRAYRENDYLWGRLHGAERLIDLVASTLDERPLKMEHLDRFKREAFCAILDEEEGRLTIDPELIAGVRNALASWPA
ncbi:patatin-like protein [Novosphingobium sp. M1R2S20]|uniref:Patatin-like protein n=1 Tax=Novosphingobium rhizovicinum TaxID=3228928 RepID=A0ABV3RBQ6_9SPHN